MRTQVVFRLPWILALATVLPSWAATQLVTNINDSGSGSLRAAVAGAASGDTVSFSLPNPSIITLASPIMISTSLKINGPGAAQLAISGNKSVQVFYVNAGTTVTISGLTIENGSSSSAAYDAGGAIFNIGNLTLSNCILSGNSGGLGGAIASGVDENGNSNLGSLTVLNCTISGNSATGYGGGIGSFSRLSISDSAIVNNSTSQSGGGIFIETGVSTLSDSTVSGNLTPDNGGGILSFGTLTVTNSTVTRNSAGFQAGGIFSNTDGGFPGSVGILTLVNSTIAGNSASEGSGVYSDLGGTLTVKSTLLSGNSGGNCVSNGVSVSQGYNLSDDSSCAAAFNTATDKNAVAAGLDPKGLQNNGGPTQTIALLPTSPAVDAIPVTSCTDTQGNRIATDQRGITRPQGPACDIGAFELVESVPFSSFCAQLEIFTHKSPGFNLFAYFTLAAGQTLTPLTEAVALTVGSYSVTLPAGSFQKVQIGPVTDYAYVGTINNVKLDLQIVPLGGSSYGFQAAATPVTLTGSTSSVPVTLTIGQDTGTTTVTPVIVRN